MTNFELLVTLWPSFPHFQKFSRDNRLAGIRLNSAMMDCPALAEELTRLGDYRDDESGDRVPLWFDIKGRQPRVVEVIESADRLDVRLNHAISVETPVPVLFKAGEDHALLDHLEELGQRLVFAPGASHGPANIVRAGESLHIRHPSFKIHAPLFTDAEVEKVKQVRVAGINRWFLSYVEEWDDVAQFLALVGEEAEVMLKIESRRGVKFVRDEWVKHQNLTLVAARGDLYVEIDRPHAIAEPLRLIAERDPKAVVGSRILLSTIQSAVPSCSDFLDLEWLADIGYRRMMLCDELCLKDALLSRAVNAFDAWKREWSGTSA